MKQFETADISERLVGITPRHLNKFVQQGLAGIRPSIQAGKVRAQRRLFSEEDVFGIALIWMLFEAGLRADPIRRIQRQIVNAKKGSANDAAKRLIEQKAEYLLIIRQPRGPSKEPDAE